MRKMTKRSAIIVGSAVAAIGVGAAAWAAGWAVLGEGDATAKSADIKKLTATATVTGNVYPGAQRGITLTVNNPNEFPVAVTPNSFKYKDITVTGGKDADTCKSKLTATAFGGLTEISGTGTVPADKSAVVTAKLTIGDLPQECAAKTFKLAYDFAGVSAA